jgi:putative aldouronate transport system substrate-binding protein
MDMGVSLDRSEPCGASRRGLFSSPVARPLADAATSRRDFLAFIGLGTVAAVGGVGLTSACGKRASAQGAATNADAVLAVLPKYMPIELVKPDIPGQGPLPSGYLHYPAHRVRVIADRPGSSGRVIRTMSPSWGPIAPGLGRNSFVDAVNAELGVPVNPSVQDGNTYAGKLSAILAARDIPDLLSAPAWDLDKIPRFSQAVKALFADLTEYLAGDAVEAYPMLATLPAVAWQYSVWGGRLAAVPFPTDGPFPWMLFYRKDLTDRAGVAAPKTIDEFYEFGKKMTNPSRGVWAFGNIFEMVQMFFKCPNCKTGWRKKAGGGLEHKYEIPEYRQALEFSARLYKEGMVHPDIVASKGADAKQLFNAGKMIAWRDGPGAWRGMQSEQAKVTPGYKIQPIPIFSAVGGEPLVWNAPEPVFYTFVKKGLGADRNREILRVLNWCAAPFGSEEWELNQFGVEDKHFTRAADGSPAPTELGRKELDSVPQYSVLGGRAPVEFATADVPHYVEELLAYSRKTVEYLEPDLFKGIKLELPSNYSKIIDNTEDKVSDILRGRRAITDLDQIVKEWRRTGGDEGRAFLEKILAANGR